MVQLVITLMDNGQLQVTGPIQDRMLCYGMLEVARDVIRDQQPKPGGLIAVRQPLDGGKGV